MPTCWIIAGPNGGGKTTFALEYLSKVADCSHFVNADLIAAGLSASTRTRTDCGKPYLFERNRRKHQSPRKFCI